MTSSTHPQSHPPMHFGTFGLLCGLVVLLIVILLNHEPETPDEQLERRIEANRLDVHDDLDKIRNDNPFR